MAVRGMVPGDFVRKRIQVAFLLILACYLGLIARLVYLQGAQGPMLRAQAEQIREQRIPLRAHRGSIYDRDGKSLAASLYSGTVGFDPSLAPLVSQPTQADLRREKRLKVGIARAAAILGMPEDKIAAIIQEARARLNPEKPVRFVTIKKDVPLETALAIKESRGRLFGFGVLDDSKRVYSSARNAAHVVGFLDSEGAGAAGLERSANRWLEGREGFALAEVDDRRRQIPDTLQKLVPARDGLDVRTTLDAAAQHIATQEARRIVEKFHPLGVSIVVLEPGTGDVLALVSMPNFDPNPGKRETLTDEALAERCASRQYEPGSTMKAVTVAAAMNMGLIDIGSGLYCGGRLQIGRRSIRCDLHGASERNGHGYVTPTDILRRSCNIASAQIALKMGGKKLHAVEKRFGLLDPLNVGLPGEEKGRWSFSKLEKPYNPGKVARIGFGHAITTTPLHVALAYAAIANGGKLMKPRLITAITDANGNVREKFAPKVVRRVLSEKTAEQVTAMLRSVVSNGTAKEAAIPGYQIAGKTGTAEKYRRGAYVGSFIGFLPAGPNVKPRAVVLVAVDEPKGAYYGREVAVPAFHNISRRLMAAWQVPEDDPEATQARAAAQNLRRMGIVVNHQ